MSTVRLCDLAMVNPASPEFEKLSSDDSVAFLPMENVWPDGLSFEERVKSQVEVGYTRFQPGDVLVPKIAPTFGHGRSAVADELRTGAGAGTTELHVLRPKPGVDPRWLFYLTKAAPFLQEGIATQYGVAGQKRISFDWFRTFRVPNLPLEEQRQIVAYLDTETARIDRLISEQRQVLALIEERRWAGVVDRIARSGPEVALRRGLTWLTDGPFGSAYSSADYVDDGPAVIRLGNIGFAEWRGAEIARAPVELFERFRRYEVRAGDVLIASLGDDRNHAGRACVAPPELGPAMVKGKCLCARTHSDRLTPAFMALFLSSPLGADALSLEARGSTRKMINLEIIKSVRIPLPPVSQQLAIVGAIEAEWAALRRLSYEVQHQQVLLNEHRQALITAAVTGDLEAVGRVA